MKKLLLMLLCAFIVPAYAFAGYDDVANRIDALFGGKEGIVVSAEGTKVYTDTGANAGAVVGMEYTVVRETEKVVHPITGKVLGARRVTIGTIVLTDVQPEYSVGEYTGKEAVQPKDIVSIAVPASVALDLQKLDVFEAAALKDALGRGRNFRLVQEAPYVLHAVAVDEAGFNWWLTSTKGREVVRGFSAYAGLTAQKNVQSGATLQLTFHASAKFDDIYTSIAAGHFLTKDATTLAVSTKDAVDIFNFDTDFSRIARIIKGAELVVSVEAADLNGNGLDELFVSIVEDNEKMRSRVFEWNGKEFVMLQKDIPYLFRTFIIGGKTKLVGQKIGVDGAFIGGMYEFTANKGRYERLTALQGTEATSLYGSAFGDIDGDGEIEALQVDVDNHLRAYKKGKEMFRTREYFGDTPRKLVMMETKKVLDTLKSETEQIEVLERIALLRSRYFVLEDGSMLLLDNERTMRAMVNRDSFTASRIMLYSFKNRVFTLQWKTQDIEPTVMDMAMVKSGGQYHIFMVRKVAGGLLSSDRSDIMHFQFR